MAASGKFEHPFGTAESLSLEFKAANNKLPSSFFETVCAFLNMEGGTIVLGIEDKTAMFWASIRMRLSG